MQYGSPVPGFAGYTVTENGDVFCSGVLLRRLKNKCRAARVRVKDPAGKSVRIAIAKLLAVTFIPNPRNHSRIIFKDRDKDNCTVSNIQWVSAGEFIRFVNGYTERADLFGAPKPRREPDWIDPARVPLNGFPGYYITPAGVCYKGDKIMKPVVKKGKSLKVRIRQGGCDQSFGLAKLVAEHFVPKPGKGCRYIVFKDRNCRNCRSDNIAWVDGETFTYYCGIHIGSKKQVLPREQAIQQCKDMYLRNYYQTLDESWLHECWNALEKKITLSDWKNYRSECYLYFFDRAKRFSILGNPLGLMLQYMKGVRAKLDKEISPYMPLDAVLKTDESLRVLKIRKIIY